MKLSEHFFLWVVLLLTITGGRAAVGIETKVVYDLEKMWEIDGNDDGLIIGFVDDAIVDKQGLFYLLDKQLSQILVVDRSGGFVSTLGREGNGPGEFRNPSSIAWWRNGEVAVGQSLPARIKLISVDGIPGETVNYLRSGEIQVSGVQRFKPYSNGIIFQTSVNSNNGEILINKTNLIRCNNVGEEVEIIKRHELIQYKDNYIMDEKLITPIWAEWVCKKNGTVIWVGDRDKYSLFFCTLGESPKSFSERDYLPLPRTINEVAAIKELWESLGVFPNIKAIVENNYPAITRLFLGPSDQTWVVTRRNVQEKAKGSLLLAEVHNSDGSHNGTVELVLPKGMMGGRILSMDGTFVLARFRVNEDGSFPQDPHNCSNCIPVYVAFELRKR